MRRAASQSGVCNYSISNVSIHRVFHNLRALWSSRSYASGQRQCRAKRMSARSLCYTGVRMDAADNLPGLAYVPVERTPVEELQARAERLQSLMREAGVDGVMATHNADVFYLSGTLQQAQVYLPSVGEPVVMVRKHLGRAGTDSSLPPESVIGVRSLRELPGLIEAAGGRPE